jgi:hypothetical protein
MTKPDVSFALRLAIDMIADRGFLPSEEEEGRELALKFLPRKFDALRQLLIDPAADRDVLVYELEKAARQLAPPPEAAATPPQPLNDRERKRQRATMIHTDIKVRADELRKLGVHNPVEQAESEIAQKHGHKNGPALNRWLRRNR